MTNNFKPKKERAIWLARSAKRANLSRLGGLPSLGTGQKWPRHLTRGTPLHFLAQVDLAELPPTPLKKGGPKLPRQGVLMVFADMNCDGNPGGYDDWITGDPQDCTRILYANIPGPDRAAPSNLRRVTNMSGTRLGSFVKDISVFPKKPLEAHAIDTFEDAKTTTSIR